MSDQTIPFIGERLERLIFASNDAFSSYLAQPVLDRWFFGIDTMQIAREFQLSEATVYNIVAHRPAACSGGGAIGAIGDVGE